MTRGIEAVHPVAKRESSYGVDCHKHFFAAWAASRAASVNGCRFRVVTGRKILEACGFTAEFCTPEQLPMPTMIDEQHRKWRSDLIKAAQRENLTFTHGVAAKLVNCYLKSRFVCGGYHLHARVRGLHPPIDMTLLKGLAAQNVGGYGKEWRRAGRIRWSNFNSEQYEHVIELVRKALNGEPLWKIEEYWPGNQ